MILRLSAEDSALLRDMLGPAAICAWRTGFVQAVVLGVVVTAVSGLATWWLW